MKYIIKDELINEIKNILNKYYESITLDNIITYDYLNKVYVIFYYNGKIVLLGYIFNNSLIKNCKEFNNENEILKYIINNR